MNLFAATCWLLPPTLEKLSELADTICWNSIATFSDCTLAKESQGTVSNAKGHRHSLGHQDPGKM